MKRYVPYVLSVLFSLSLSAVDVTLGTWSGITWVGTGDRYTATWATPWNVNTGLFLYYPLDDAEGTTVTDAISANNGYWISSDNATQSTPGIIGNAKTFTSADIVSMQVQGICDFVNGLADHDLTISIWLKVPDWSLSDAYAGPFEFGDWGVFHIWRADYNNAGPIAFLPGQYIVPAATAIHPENEWFHWALVWNHLDNSTVQYVNGVPLEIDPVNAITNVPTVNMALTIADNLFLGSALGGAGSQWGWNGNAMDEFRLYSIALSPAQIQTLYNWRGN